MADMGMEGPASSIEVTTGPLCLFPRSQERRNQTSDKRRAGYNQHLEYEVGEISVATGGNYADQQQPADDGKERHAHPPEEVRQRVVLRRPPKFGDQQNHRRQGKSDPDRVADDVQRTDHNEKQRREHLHIGVVTSDTEFFKSLSTKRI